MAPSRGASKRCLKCPRGTRAAPRVTTRRGATSRIAASTPYWFQRGGVLPSTRRGSIPTVVTLVQPTPVLQFHRVREAPDVRTRAGARDSSLELEGAHDGSGTWQAFVSGTPRGIPSVKLLAMRGSSVKSRNRRFIRVVSRALVRMEKWKR